VTARIETLKAWQRAVAYSGSRLDRTGFFQGPTGDGIEDLPGLNRILYLPECDVTAIPSTILSATIPTKTDPSQHAIRLPSSHAEGSGKRALTEPASGPLEMTAESLTFTTPQSEASSDE